MSPSAFHESEVLGNEGIPSGTVQARVQQLHRLAGQRPSSPPYPISERDRDNEHSGWGTRVGSQARFIQPATHSKTIESRLGLPWPVPTTRFQHALPSRYPSIGKDGLLILKTVPKGIVEKGPEMEAQQHPRSSPDDNIPADANLRATQAEATVYPAQLATLCSVASSDMGRELYENNSTVRRAAARDFFEQYGISRPSGWLSDEENLCFEGDGTQGKEWNWRLCHICKRKIRSGDFCSSCGHPLCRTCTCEVPTDSVEANVVHDIPKAPHMRTPQEFQDESSQAEIETLANQNSNAEPPKEPDPLPASPDPKNSLRDNPFIVADRIAKARIVEPQTNKTDIQAVRHRKSSESCSCESARVGSPCRKNQHPHRHSIGCQLRPQVHEAPQHLDTFGEHLDESPPETSTQHIINQLYQHAEDLYRAQHIMEHISAAESSGAVHTDHGLHTSDEPRLAEDSGYTHLPMPKVRTYSPPLWLRNPSNKPGSLDGKLQRIDTIARLPQKPSVNEVSHDQLRGIKIADLRLKLKHHEIDRGKSQEPTKTSDVDLRSRLKHYSPKTSIGSALEVFPTPVSLRKISESNGNTKPVGHDSCENCGPHQTYQSTPGLRGSANKAIDEMSNSKLGREEAQPREKETAAASASSNSPGSSVGVSDSEVQRPTPMVLNARPSHECSWKIHYMDIAARMRQMEAENWLGEQGQLREDGETPRDSDLAAKNDEVGIQGLTIVLHLRGKDDLVISTDLTQDAE